MKRFRAHLLPFQFWCRTVGKWSALAVLGGCVAGSFSMRGTHHISPEAHQPTHTRHSVLTVSRLKYEKIAPLSKQTLYHLQLSQNLLDNWTFGAGRFGLKGERGDASQNMWVRECARSRLAGRKSLRALLASTTWQIDWHIMVAYRACDMLAKKNAVSLLCLLALGGDYLSPHRDKNRLLNDLGFRTALFFGLVRQSTATIVSKDVRRL